MKTTYISWRGKKCPQCGLEHESCQLLSEFTLLLRALHSSNTRFFQQAFMYQQGIDQILQGESDARFCVGTSEGSQADKRILDDYVKAHE